MTTTTRPGPRPRTAAASRLPRPPHTWCEVRLPIQLVPAALIVLDGDVSAVDELLHRMSTVNDDRLVLSPGPLALRRPGDDAAAATQSIATVQPALLAGSPVVIAGSAPPAVIATGEPLPDLVATLRRVGPEAVSEPRAVGSIRRGFAVTLYGAHGADHFMHLLGAMFQSSLAAVPVRRRSR